MPVKTCLCIGLDPDFFYLIESYAQRSGIQALAICTQDAKMPQVSGSIPSVIFLAEEPPHTSLSWQVLETLKTDPATMEIPVIFSSWFNQEAKALEAGADIFVQKPVMYADFLRALNLTGILPG